MSPRNDRQSEIYKVLSEKRHRLSASLPPNLRSASAAADCLLTTVKVVKHQSFAQLRIRHFQPPVTLTFIAAPS
jgi:hypothetical protein